MARLCLQRTVPKKRDYTLYAFDIEYTRDTGELIEACIGDEHEQWFFTEWTCILNMLFWLSKKHKNTRFIVHAGDIAEYNHLCQYILEHQRQEIEVLPTTSGDNIVALELHRGKDKVKLCDLFAIFPMALEKIAKVFAPDYPKLAGTVDFSTRDYDPTTDREYLRRDVQATVNSYRNLSAMIEKHFGVQPALTSAGTAMRAWLASLEKGVRYFRLNDVVEDFCRTGYFGAYVYPGVDNELHHNVVSYDITAAYGARMRYTFPIGNPMYTTEYNAEGHGMWHCEVTCIDASLPIVPYRTKDGVSWLGVPGDKCQGVYITQEVEYFRAHGYSVRVLYGQWWQQSGYIFKDFIDKVEQVESIDAITKQCAKLMRNSLYGRFGTKKYHEKFVITSTPSDDFIPYTDPHTGKFLDNIYTKEEELDVAYIQPHWAAHITAYQRLAMFELIFQCGVEHCFGCDTDSIKPYSHLIEEKGLPISETEYGKGKIEAYFKIYRSHGPKNYVGIDTEEHFAMKSKGVPKKALTKEHMKQHLYRNETTDISVDFVSPTKALTMIKKNGTMPFNSKRKRKLSSLHSTKWKLVNKRFIPVENMVQLKA